jgi:hypothetical protein
VVDVEGVLGGGSVKVVHCVGGRVFSVVQGLSPGGPNGLPPGGPNELPFGGPQELSPGGPNAPGHCRARNDRPSNGLVAFSVLCFVTHIFVSPSGCVTIGIGALAT